MLLRDDRPSFRDLMGRQHARNPHRIESMSRSDPVTYVVFDLLYRGFEPIMDEPLVDRRAHLQEAVAQLGEPRLVFSDGVIGSGEAFFEQVREQKFEGIVAKRLDSQYLPGQRTDAWTKIKQAYHIHCAIIGYLPADDDPDDPKSLIIATEEGGELRAVGRVGSGLTTPMRARLISLLKSRTRDEPLVPCTESGVWVDPGLYCTVSYLEKSETGLRAPVFVDLE